MTSGLKAVLFDLDDTLFDQTLTSRAALSRVREAHPEFSTCALEDLVARHYVVLEELHARVLAGEITIEEARVERFTRLLAAAGAGATAAAERAVVVAATYRRAYEASWQLVAGASALVDAVRQQGLAVVVVTNNSVAEQRLKLDRLGMTPRVDALVTSEEVGAAKPAPEIFRAALGAASARPSEAVMLGDSWAADIEGARAAGIRAVWFNRTGTEAPDPTVPVVRDLASALPHF